MNLGDVDITRIYLGDTQIFKAYLGANVIYTEGTFSWNVTSLIGAVGVTWAFANDFTLTDTDTHVTVEWV